ncbi:MAG: HAD-IIIA family hydrolase [Thermodesulfobacteriota bacterium]
MGSKAVFLDRDKTIVLPNGGDHYIYRSEDFYIPDTFVRSLKSLTDNDYLLFVITNQGRIAKGHLTEQDVEELHQTLDQILRDGGVHIAEYEYCPHNPRGSIYPYNIVCDCRKPKTGMIDNIKESYEIETPDSWMIGDSYIDMIAGKKAGLKTIQVMTGSENYSDYADYVEPDLVKAAKRILEEK